MMFLVFGKERRNRNSSDKVPGSARWWWWTRCFYESIDLDLLSDGPGNDRSWTNWSSPVVYYLQTTTLLQVDVVFVAG